jgi:hypothetical protein
MYIHDLLLRRNSVSEPVLFTDDMSNSSKSGDFSHSTKEKKIIRNKAGAQPRTSRSNMFKQLQIPPIPLLHANLYFL